MNKEDERRTILIRPGKAVSVVSFIVIIFMVLFGVGFTILVGNVLYEEEAPLIGKVLFFIFMVGWIGAALFMLVYHYLNLKRPHGVPIAEIEIAPGLPEAAVGQDTDSRFRGSEELKK
jgi:hypothetical protein